jgi:hypothetical protein
MKVILTQNVNCYTKGTVLNATTMTPQGYEKVIGSLWTKDVNGKNMRLLCGEYENMKVIKRVEDDE